MSQKIRIGNDVGIFWTLKDADGNPYNLRGRDIAVEIVIGLKKCRVKELELTADNTIHFVYWGKDQKYTGFCDLKFIENDGQREMVTFDTANAFTLVPHSWQAIDEGETPETIQIEVVSVASELLEKVGPKGDTGDPAGFGPVTAEVDANVGTPSVEVTASGPDTAKEFHFAFHNVKGETGAQGPQGIQGQTGPQGPAGSDADVTRANIEAALNGSAGKNLSTEDYTSAEKQKLAGIEGGAQANILEGVKVNGTDLEITKKKVNVSVPTALSQMGEDTTHRTVTDTEKTAWNGKQNAINDLQTIREGAAAGATAYQKPSGGIPASDLASGVIPDISGKEDSSNRVTSLSASSTDTQYPSAKAVYDVLYENVLIYLGVNAVGTASDLIGLKVTVTNADTSEQISEQTWNGTPLVVRIKAGVRYTVSVQTHPDYVTPAPQTFTSELASTRSVGFIYNYSAVIDLSYRNTDGTKKMVQDTANSYVARVAGDYKLPAVYGNAIKNGAANAAAYTRQGSTYTADFVNYKGAQITSPYIETDTGETIASAALLWQTGTNLISNVAFSGGYVTFTVNSIPSENGLAVLAVKDGNGNIMWSWTIWLTTDTLTAEKFTNYTEVDYYLMPENIFCIWNEQRTNYGTGMIQWGRKDVMVPNIPGSGTQMTVYDIDGNAITPGTALGSAIGVFGTDADQSADKTVANSIKNPGMFFTSYDSTNHNWNNLAWFNNFWNAAETSSASMADNQDTAVKTIYDPCPFGWMLPAGRAFTGFTTTGGGTPTAAQFNVVGSWNAGWNFKRNAEDTEGNRFPASGYRANGSGALTYVGSYGYFWSFAPGSLTDARFLYFYSGGVYPSNYGYRAYGFAVRPSRE